MHRLAGERVPAFDRTAVVAHRMRWMGFVPVIWVSVPLYNCPHSPPEITLVKMLGKVTALLIVFPRPEIG